MSASVLVDRFPRLQQAQPRELARLDALVSNAREFAETVVRPRSLEIDRRVWADPTYFDRDLVRAGGEAGMLSLLAPRAAGGAGGLAVEVGLVMEELCAACPGIALVFGAHALGMSPLLFVGPAHWDGVLADVVAAARSSEPLLMAFAMTEPDAGTDMEDVELLRVARTNSHARRVAGGYRLSGTKRFISNGSVARWITALMPTDARNAAGTMTCFLVDSTQPGFRVGHVEHKMGQRACPAAELVFDDVFVPDERVVGRVGDGASFITLVLASSRPPVGAIATGIARGAYERLNAWLHEDPAARGLLGREHVQLTLATMAERIHLARQAYLDAGTELDRSVLGLTRHPIVRAAERVPRAVRTSLPARWLAAPGPARDLTVELLHRSTDARALTRTFGLSSMAKAVGSDVAMAVTDAALGLVGLDAGPVRVELEKLWRDAKLTQIYEGTNQLNRIEVFRGLCDEQTLDCLPRRRRARRRETHLEVIGS